MDRRTALRARKRGKNHLVRWFLVSQDAGDECAMTTVTDDPWRVFDGEVFAVVASILALHKHDAQSAFADAGYLDWDEPNYRGLTDRSRDLGTYRLS